MKLVYVQPNCSVNLERPMSFISEETLHILVVQFYFLIIFTNLRCKHGEGKNNKK